MLRYVLAALLFAAPALGQTAASNGDQRPILAFKPIAVALGVDFNLAGDQIIPVNPWITRYEITGAEVLGCTANPSTAVGGIYTAASKGGAAVVPASQTYSGANASVLPTSLTAGVSTTLYSGDAPPYFNLTTLNGSAVKCDVYIDGKDRSPDNH